MKLSSRSYPHPVVGNGDDVPNAAFQATFDLSSDKQFYFINVTVACSSTKLNKMLKDGTARYVLHVECGNTLYREAFDFSENSKRFDITADRLNGPVEVNCFIRASDAVQKYRVDGAHEDYGDSVFEVRSGDILAVGEGLTFEADPQDTLRRIGSIMVIEQSAKEADHPMEVEFSGEKIRIFLSKQDFERYKELKAVPTLTSHLTTTIVLPVLLEAVHLIKEEGTTYDELKWYRNLKGRIEDLGQLKDDDSLKTAQLLLDLPIRRAFAAAAQYATER